MLDSPTRLIQDNEGSHPLLDAVVERACMKSAPARLPSELVEL